jgi:cytosine deaminase
MREALRMGADVVGGHLSIAEDYRAHSERVYEMAAEFDRDVDIHVDIDIDRDYSATTRHEDGREYPEALGVVAMALETARRGYRGRAAASHLCALDTLPPQMAGNVISLLAETGVGVVALPPGNLFTHGRADLKGVRRGVTRVRGLLEGGVLTAFGTDNIRDPFNPLGNPNMVHNAILTAYACHMASSEDFRATLKMCTDSAAKIMGLSDYGLAEGRFADLVVLDAKSVEEALATQAMATHVFKRGRLVARNEVRRQLFLDA